MPNTTSSEFGDIVLVAFPFTDQLGMDDQQALKAILPKIIELN